MKKILDYQFTTDYPKYRQGILKFWQETEGDSRQASFDSAYVSNPLGSPMLGLCHDGEKLVGTENYLRQNVAYDGTIYSGAMGIDTLVDSNYRLFHGVFGRLCEITHENMKNDFDILCAKPNETSKKYYLDYFDWQIASKVGVHKKIIGSKLSSLKMPLSLLRQGRKDKQLTIKPVKSFVNTGLEQVIDRYVMSSTNAYFHKTCAYLDWKFLKHKVYSTVGYLLIESGTLVGYCITYDRGAERRILDLLVENDSEELFEKAISTLIRMSKQDGIHVLAIHAAEFAWYKPILRKLIFMERETFEFITLPYLPRLSNVRWVIHQGDFDVF